MATLHSSQCKATVVVVVVQPYLGWRYGPDALRLEGITGWGYKSILQMHSQMNFVGFADSAFTTPT